MNKAITAPQTKLTVKEKYSARLKSSLERGRTINTALTELNTSRNYIYPIVWLGGNVGCASLAFFLGNGIGIAGTIGLILGMVILVVGSFIGLSSLEKKLNYTKDKFIASLTGEDKVEVIKLIELNDRRISLKGEYLENHEKFIIRYFGVYSTQLSLILKHEFEMDKTGNYLLEVVNHQSDKYKALKKEIENPIKIY